MSSTLNIALTDELRSFINENSGDGTLYSTPSEFIRAILREKKDRLDAARVRESIREGYQDLIHGRYLEYKNNLDELLEEAERRDREGW